MLRRRTGFRITIYSIFAWVCVAVLYVALPSPIPKDDGTDYPTEVLRAGKTLTRVYSTFTYFPDHESSHAAIARARMTEQSHFALAFTIASGPSSNLSLIISEADPISLTPPSALDQGQHGPGNEEHQTEPPSILSDPFAVRSPAGELDGISLPWFTEADAALLHASVSDGHMYVTLFTRWNENGQLEVRAYGPDWATLPRTSTKKPLLTLAFSPQFSATVPEPPYSLSPTSTYPIRRILLSILAVSIFTPIVLYTLTSHILYTILSILVWAVLIVLVLLAALWVFRGGPAVGEFSSDVKRDVESALDELQKRWVARRNPKRDAGVESLLVHHGPVEPHADLERRD